MLLDLVPNGIPWIPLSAALAAAACSGARAPADADGDGVVAGLDCDDSNPALRGIVSAYADVDGDGVGAGTAGSFCTGGSAPAGYSLQGTDCAPGDPALWRAAVDPFVDRDGDGYTARETGSICYGASPPDPYRAAATGNDCDDANPALYRWVVLYRDQDGDGAPPRWIPCLGASLPPGWATHGYDPDNLDPGIASDADADDILRLVD